MFHSHCKPQSSWALPAHRAFTNAMQQAYFQGVNVAETADNFTIEVALPGFVKEEVSISFDNLLLTIKAEKNTSTEEKTTQYNRRGFVVQNFKRTFEVPKNTIVASDITAVLENGILVVPLPKIKVEKTQNETINININ